MPRRAPRLGGRGGGSMVPGAPRGGPPRPRTPPGQAWVLTLGPLLARTGRAVVPKPGGDDIGMRRVDQHIAGLRQMGATVEEHDGQLVCSARRLVGAEIQLDLPTVTGTENLVMAAVTAR